MKRANNPNSPAKSPHTATGDTTAKHQHQELDQHRAQKQPQQQAHSQQPHKPPLYCPTDETDLTIGDQQQVSLLDSRESTAERQQTLTIKGTTFSFAANMIGSKKTENGDQALQRQAKKRAGQKKKNILAAGDGVEDDLESNCDSRTSGPSAKCWTILILMGLLVALFLVVITFLVIRKPNEADVCPDTNQPFQASSYRLFATKTLYNTALKYLSLVSLDLNYSPTMNQTSMPAAPTTASLVSIGAGAFNAEASLHQATKVDQQHTIDYDKSSIHRPSFFLANETLEQVDRRMSSMGCEPKQFHFYARHAARYPSRRELERLSSAFQAIKKRIDLIISPSTAPEGRSQSGNTSKPACFDPLLKFSNWQMFAQPNQANLITPTGAVEIEKIAIRYKRIFPQLFDAKRTKISIGTTNKIRTAQSAVNFLQHLDNYDPGVCPLSQFSPVSSSPEGADTIRNDRCYKTLIANHKRRELSFHKSRCAASSDAAVDFKLDRAALAQWITQSVSKSLKLDNPELTFDEMKALYDLCKYETAITASSSIWCSLFNESHMKFMEYMEDLKTYKKVAYGNAAQARSACLLTKPLIDNYRAVKDSGEMKVADQKAQFYFTHSQVIQKLIASGLRDEKKEPAFRDYESKLRSRDVPKDRDWQTSLLSPFSANMAFILYTCSEKDDAARRSGTAETNQAATLNQFDVSRRHSRVVVALNEQPVIMSVDDYPQRVDQPLDIFYSSTRFAQAKSCRAEDICPQVSGDDLLDGAETSEDDEHDESHEIA